MIKAQSNVNWMTPGHIKEIVSSPQTFTGTYELYTPITPLCIHAVWNFYTCKCTEEDWFNLFMHWNMMYDKTWQCLMILLMCYTDWKMYFLHDVKNHFLRLYFKIHTNMIDFAAGSFFSSLAFYLKHQSQLNFSNLIQIFLLKRKSFYA